MEDGEVVKEYVGCRFWDAGWCYCPENVENNAFCGACKNIRECPQSLVLGVPDEQDKD